MISNFQEDERTRKPWLPSLDGELHSFDDLFRYLFQNYQYNIIEDIGVSFTRTVKSLVSWLFCCCCYQKNSLYFPKLFCGPSRRIQPGSIEKSKLPFIGFCHTEAQFFSKKGHETNIFPVLVKLTHIDLSLCLRTTNVRKSNCASPSPATLWNLLVCQVQPGLQDSQSNVFSFPFS